MSYIVKHRQHGGILAKSPYAGIDMRYIYSRETQPEGIAIFSRYVDAFNACRACDMVVEI